MPKSPKPKSITRIRDLRVHALNTQWSLARTTRVAKRAMRGKCMMGTRTRAALACACESMIEAIIKTLIKTSANSRLGSDTLAKALHTDVDLQSLFHQLEQSLGVKLSFVGDVADNRAPLIDELHAKRTERRLKLKHYSSVLRNANTTTTTTTAAAAPIVVVPSKEPKKSKKSLNKRLLIAPFSATESGYF